MTNNDALDDGGTSSNRVSRRGLLTLGAATVALVTSKTLVDGSAAQAAGPEDETLRRMSLPFKGPVTQVFNNPQWYGPHRGTDFGIPSGTPIPSAGTGTVIENSFGTQIGHYLVIQHSSIVRTRYHMLQAKSPLAVGSSVSHRQTIGYVGASGSTATGPHLHFELHINGTPQDPMKRLSAEGVPDPSIPSEPNGEDDMIRIQSPGRGIALIGAGYYRPLVNAEEVEQSSSIISKHVSGNDRQFDLWVSMAVAGQGAKSS